MSQWIKCSERLPERMTSVLVLTPGGEITTAYLKNVYIGVYGEGCERYWAACITPMWCDDDTLECKFTHWMPLPEPPSDEVKP